MSNHKLNTWPTYWDAMDGKTAKVIDPDTRLKPEHISLLTVIERVLREMGEAR